MVLLEKKKGTFFRVKLGENGNGGKKREKTENSVFPLSDKSGGGRVSQITQFEEGRRLTLKEGSPSLITWLADWFLIKPPRVDPFPN